MNTSQEDQIFQQRLEKEAEGMPADKRGEWIEARTILRNVLRRGKEMADGTAQPESSDDLDALVCYLDIPNTPKDYRRETLIRVVGIAKASGIASYLCDAYPFDNTDS